MKNTLKCTFILLCLILAYPLSSQFYKDLAEEGNLTFDEIVEQAELYFESYGKGKGTGYRPFKRWEYFSRRSLDSNGKIISNSESLKRFNKVRNTLSKNKTVGNTWVEMGPQSATNTSTWSSHIGRVSALAVDPNDADHLVIGSPGGGIWKTLDNGNVWTPIFDQGVNLSVWSMMISHANNQHYFAGVSGNGVMRSLDGGMTWSNTAGIGGTITTVLMDPISADTILGMRDNGNVYRSVDGGANWAATDAANVVTGSLYDMEFMPGNSNIVYISGRNGVYKSEDKGVTFEVLLGPWESLPDNYDDQPKMMAVTPHDPDYLYVLGSNSGGFGAVYLSTDAGATWTTQFTEYCDCVANSDCPTLNIMGYDQGSCGGQAPRDMDIVVSDTDKTEVHVAGVETWKSVDSGVTFTQSTDWRTTFSGLPFVHADVDLMQYIDGIIYFGTDGGLFTSDDGVATVEDKTTGLGIRQFYRIGVSATDYDRVSGGSQDNGTGIVNDMVWYDFVGADGMETFIDKNDEDVVYATIQFGGLYKSTNGGITLSGITNPPGSGDWVTPLEQDPIALNTLYQGRQQVHKSSDGGASWAAISDFATPPSGSNRLQEVTVAPSDNDVIYAAFQRVVYRTTNAGTNWTDVSPTTNFTNVNYISIHPTNPNKILLSLSGGDTRLVESTDGGVTWNDISNGLPNIAVQCAIYENGPSGDEGIYVATNPGVWYKDDNMATWDVLDVGIPNVNVTELQIEHTQLYAATYGRGLWKTDLIDDLDCNLTSIIELGDQICDADLGTYERDIQVTYANPPASGMLTVNGIDFPIKGSPQTITLTLPLDGLSVDVTASFSSSPACALTVNDLFTNLSNCPCNLFFDNTQLVSCNDNGTTDPVDDTFTLSINPVGDYTSATYSVTGDLMASNIPYGTPYVFDNNGAGYPVGAGEYTLVVTDDVDPICTIGSISFLTPDNCSSNYFCQDATLLTTSGTYTASGPNQGGGGSQSGRDANWFVFYPSSNGLLTVRSCLEGVDTRLLLHRGGCANLSNLEIIDDNCEQTAGGDNYASEIVDYCLDLNTEYYIEWDDRWSESGFDFEFTFVPTAFYADMDGDGFGDPNVILNECTAMAGYVMDNTDCDDTDPNNYPGNVEICGDGLDNNCDGMIDEGCTTEPCDGDYLVINTISQNIYRAEIDLDSDAQLVDGQDILFTAQNSIDLESGFEVPTGAVFEAIIDFCVPGSIANIVSDDPQDNLAMLLNGLMKKVVSSFSEKSNIEIKISNVKGSEVLSKVDFKNVEGALLTKIAELNQGIYFINISDNKKEVTQKILIVE